MEGSTNTKTRQRSGHEQPNGDGDARRLSVKNEWLDDDDMLGDEDSDEDSYKPRPQLPKPFVVMRTLAHLMRDLENGIIDVDPEYQREVVWTADRMTGLINSLMENFYIPPIILDKKTQSAPNVDRPHFTLVCVDGKQRLSSVRAFIKGMIPCHDHRGEKWWFSDNPGSRRKKILPEETQKLFLSKEFVSFEFTDLSPDQEEDLFARVQMGVQLSPAEKMRASTGPWQELARLFVDDFPAIYSLMKDRARAKDFQLTLSCFSQILEVMHPVSSNGIPMLKTNYSALPRLLSNKGAVDDGIKSHLAGVWNTFEYLVQQDPNAFNNADKYLTGVQTFAPVEMVAVAVLISMYSDSRNNRLLLGDIKALRIALREHFTDLRLHAQVWKFVWDYLEDLEAIRGAVDGSTVNRKLLESPLRQNLATALVPKVQRRRPTSSAKSRSVLPPSERGVVRREEGGCTPLLDTRSSKRKRTDTHDESGEPSGMNRPIDIVTSPHFSNGAWTNSQSGRSSTTRQSFSSTPLPNVQKPATSQHAQMPSNVSRSMARNCSSTTISPQRTNTPPQLAQASLMQAASVPIGATTFAWRNRTPRGSPTKGHSNDPSQSQAIDRHPSNRPAQISLPTPAEVRQSRVSELNSYRAPTAPMGASAPIVSTSQNASTQSMSSSNMSHMAPLDVQMSQTHRLNNGNPTLQTGIGAFAPSHTEKQWEGEVKSTSPPTPQQVSSTATSPPGPLATARASTTPLGQSRPARRPQKKVPRPTPAQYDGAIDLTSDTELELERQELLSSFKGKSLANAAG